MARRRLWIGMAVAVPATVAFTPFHPLEPPPQDPNVLTTPQPVVATTPAAPAQSIVATTPTAAARPVAATTPAAAAQPVVVTTPTPVAAAPATPQGVPPNPGTMTAPPDRNVGPIVVDAALSRLGAPYAWGGAGPDDFDCSGLVVWAFHQAGITLPHSSQALASGGQEVTLDQMQPGDVISFFPDASHVGIYVGGGRVVDAPYEEAPVAIESLDNAPINNIRRYG